MTIHRSVSSYSYQQTYYTGRMNLKQLLAATAQVVESPGFELIAEQMPVGSYPDPDEKAVAEWQGWLREYNLTPTCMDSFIDTMLYKDRFLTRREQVALMERDLKLANRLGFPVIRVLTPVRKEIVESSLDLAAKYNVKMGLEVHNPMTLRSRWIVEYMEMVVKSGSKHAGLIPDFGIFAMRPPRKLLDNARKEGAKPEVLDQIVALCEAHRPVEELFAAIGRMGGAEPERKVALTWVRNNFNDPEWLRDYAPYLVHCHGKFHEMDESYHETGIDYQTPFRILKEIGYDGWISSEYEGQRLYTGAEDADEIEQVRRHHVMMKRLIGAEAAAAKA
jgi:sugar phosphate isomerase/epimerase